MRTLQTVIQEQCEAECNVNFRARYSGLGMRGKDCVGVTGTDLDCKSVISGIITTLAEALTNQEMGLTTFSEHVQTLLNHRTDSMGYGTILYWPELAADDISVDVE